MNKKSLVLSGALGLFLGASLPLFGQFAEPSPEPGASPAFLHSRRGSSNLSEEELEQMKTARIKAAQSPKVREVALKRQSVDDELRLLVRGLLLKEDASLEPILNKLDASRHGPAKAEQGQEPAPHRPGPMGAIDFAETVQLKNGLEKIKDNLGVIAAAEKWRAADTAFTEAVNAEMLSINPSLAPILEKMEWNATAPGRRINSPRGPYGAGSIGSSN